MIKIITASIVLYKNDKKILSNTIKSFLKFSSESKLFLVDNSPSDELKIFSNDSQIEYTHTPSNPGFGSSHNLAIKKAIKSGSKYHFVINPDIIFDENIIEPMINIMQENPSIGMLMPQVLNLDGSIQYLPKLLPSPFGMLLRKLKRPSFVYNKFIDRYELRYIPKNIVYNAPILSGCFTLLNLNAIKEIGMYDDNFFMYFEDWDLSRRMHTKFQTVYYPLVSVYHGYDSGANKSFKLFRIFIRSAFIYFNKWGWLFDKDRKKINNKALSQFK